MKCRSCLVTKKWLAYSAHHEGREDGREHAAHFQLVFSDKERNVGHSDGECHLEKCLPAAVGFLNTASIVSLVVFEITRSDPL